MEELALVFLELEFEAKVLLVFCLGFILTFKDVSD